MSTVENQRDLYGAQVVNSIQQLRDMAFDQIVMIALDGGRDVRFGRLGIGWDFDKVRLAEAVSKGWPGTILVISQQDFDRGRVFIRDSSKAELAQKGLRLSYEKL